MAAKKPSAAEIVLQKAESAYAKLHPLAPQGNDAAPVTRGELRIILEELLGQNGKPAAKPEPKPEPKPAAKPESKIDLTGAEQIKRLSRSMMKELAKQNGIDISGTEAMPDQGLAEYIAAALNQMMGSNPGK